MARDVVSSRLEPALDDARAALAAQSAALLAWAEPFTDDELAQPSPLEGWTRRQLLAHLAVSNGRIAELPARATEEDPLPLRRYVRAYRPAAAEILAQVDVVDGDPRTALAERTQAAMAAIDAGLPPVVMAQRGPLRDVDAILTRLIELVTHSLDLGAPAERGPLELVVRTLAHMLADDVPGRAVELRVPPIVAVQLIEGQSHRRGTPPAIVEVGPVDWVLLATGRLAWADAVADGQVRASGRRSDLSPYLPLLS